MIQVLIVEDDIRIAKINSRFVEKIEGYQVIGIATSSDQVKEMLDILSPDLVLLDLYIPNVEGFELLKYIKMYHNKTDIIMITAAKELHSVREAIHSGVFDYIVKPMVFERFKETMEHYKSFRKKITDLEKSGEDLLVDQGKIDELFRAPMMDKLHETIMPKGIDSLTLNKIMNHFKDIKGSFTVDTISREIGVSRSTSRRYLEYLVSQNIIMADLVYGTVGRPERVYRILPQQEQ